MGPKSAKEKVGGWYSKNMGTGIGQKTRGPKIELKEDARCVS